MKFQKKAYSMFGVWLSLFIIGFCIPPFITQHQANQTPIDYKN